MSNNIIESSFKDKFIIKEENLLAKLLVRKSIEHARDGKTTQITDTITGESYDFESFDRFTRNIASALYKKGFRNGDVAMYLTYDLVKLQLFQVGVWRANGIPRASYPEDDEETILERVEESRIGWIYCEPEAAEMCLSVKSKIYWEVEVIVTSRGGVEGCSSIFDYMEDDGLEMPEFKRFLKDPALILNTSGTTGKAKGAVISHQGITWMIFAILKCFYLNDSPTLIISKGTHISGCALLPGAILLGIPILVMHTIRIDYFFQAIHKYRPKMIFAFPSLLVALINHPTAQDYDFSSLEVALSGGAPVTSAIEKIAMQLPNMRAVTIVYGLTECAPLIGSMDFGDSNNIRIKDLPENSLGKFCGGVTAKFRDTETGEVLGPNQTGELCVKCPGLFTEYFGKPEATKEAFIDGYFCTGDVGYYDDNDFIFLVDRAKEIFKYYGNHVSPTEIENVINDHPAIGEVCVIGVPDPEGGGHIPRAFCVVLQDWFCTEEDIVEFTNHQLASFKHLRGGVYFLSQLPKGKTGKVSRQLVAQLKVD